jgi:hypothetical protein
MALKLIPKSRCLVYNRNRGGRTKTEYPQPFYVLVIGTDGVQDIRCSKNGGETEGLQKGDLRTRDDNRLARQQSYLLLCIAGGFAKLPLCQLVLLVETCLRAAAWVTREGTTPLIALGCL